MGPRAVARRRAIALRYTQLRLLLHLTPFAGGQRLLRLATDGDEP